LHATLAQGYMQRPSSVCTVGPFPDFSRCTVGPFLHFSASCAVGPFLDQTRSGKIQASKPNAPPSSECWFQGLSRRGGTGGGQGCPRSSFRPPLLGQSSGPEVRRALNMSHARSANRAGASPAVDSIMCCHALVSRATLQAFWFAVFSIPSGTGAPRGGRSYRQVLCGASQKG
jgi:hypothetical protein